MWETFSDLLLSPFSVPILVMQAAHPDVGAAVAKYAVYKHEPWGRLFRTGFSMMRFLYGGKQGKQSAQEVSALRALHAHIRGVRADGTSYHALTPDTFRIVPDTFLDGVIRFRKTVGKPLNREQLNDLYREYVDLCLLFGIRQSYLQPTIDDFLVYYDGLLLNTMTYNETVAFLLGDMMKYGPAIPYLPLPKRWWQFIYQHTLYPLIRIFTIGFLDARFREKHRIPWSEDDGKKYRRWVGIVRFLYRFVPRFLRYNPISLYIMLGGHGPEILSVEKLKQYDSER